MWSNLEQLIGDVIGATDLYINWMEEELIALKPPETSLLGKQT